MRVWLSLLATLLVATPAYSFEPCSDVVSSTINEPENYILEPVTIDDTKIMMQIHPFILPEPPTTQPPAPHLLGPGFKTLEKQIRFPVLHPIRSLKGLTHPLRHPQLTFSEFSNWSATTPNGPGYDALLKGAEAAGVAGIYGLYGWRR